MFACDTDCRIAVGKCRVITWRQEMHSQNFKQIYRHIMALFDNDKPADPLTVAASLARNGKLEQAGGQADINWLASEHGYSLNIGRWAEIVSERADTRNSAKACHTMARRYAVH